MAKGSNKVKDGGEYISLDVECDIDTSVLHFKILGKTPLLMNRMSEKVRQGFLLPAPPKNKAERASVLKHDPIAEFNASVYRCRDPRAPTLVHMPSEAFKSAITDVAIDIPGAFKAQIGRLVQMDGDMTVNIYGIPYLHMSIVRQAGIQKVPDIRTRAIFPEWACEIFVTHTIPLITHRTVGKLLGAAGQIIGVGDGRPQKGKLTHGQFIAVADGNATWDAIVKNQGRKAQEAAMAKPVAWGDDTAELLAWFENERRLRRATLETKKAA